MVSPSPWCANKGKLRVVFDCSAKTIGISLNDHLLQGPDLTNSLVGVLTRFREEPVAFMADIECMFYQVCVPVHQRNYLRFLWWPDGDLSKELKEYRMKVHLFGATSSPSVANYALKATATSDDALVNETIKGNFYVDDCLKSVKTPAVAKSLITNLQKTCESGGFHLAKFVSNYQGVMNGIPSKDIAKAVLVCDLNCDPLPMERALGIQWNVASDEFGFSIQVKDRPLTRRGILSIVSAIYDPLGFLAPVILPAKQILQELCKSELDWDDEIPEDCTVKWRAWLMSLPGLEKL